MAVSSKNPELMEELSRFVGLNLSQVPTPSVVLDLAKLEANCARMLDATDRLGLLWRPHIKTHKTTQLTRLQVGDSRTTLVSLVVSTMTEAEKLVPLLREYQSRGRDVNVLFSFPLFPSAVPRLLAFRDALSPNPATPSLSPLTLMIDHPSQLACLPQLPSPSQPSSPPAPPPQIFLKIDTTYRRAGVPVPVTASPSPGSPAADSGSGSDSADPCTSLIDAALSASRAGKCVLHGLYSHAGHSYGARGGWDDVAGYLAEEFRGLRAVGRLVKDRRMRMMGGGGGGDGGDEKETGKGGLVLSVGATPTALVMQREGFGKGGGGNGGGMMGDLEGLIRGLKEEGYQLEVHAGVYTTLDLQQLATHASDSSLMTADDIAISVVAEVASLYPGRGANGTTEALINAGSLALGREPVADKGQIPGQDYSGWGLLMSWGIDTPAPGPDFPRVHGGWQVGRISQEHGILVWKGKKEDEVPLRYGQRVRVWPNHSCIAGACYDWYLIVDSRNKGGEDEVVDVWPRWRGW
ncbi:hypothetical protein VTK26DRAFT_6307 [Humicola hyalothermophila]